MKNYLYLLVVYSLQLTAQPNTKVYLADVKKDGATMVISDLKNISTLLLCFFATHSYSQADSTKEHKIYWRDTTSPTLDHSRYVSDVSTCTLDGIFINNLFFGVAAVDENGHESKVVFPNGIFRD